MKTSLTLISSLVISLSAISSSALADGNGSNQNVLVDGTIQGNSKLAVISASNQKPNVDKSLDLFLDSALGKTPRITPAVNQKPNVDKSLDLFLDSALGKTPRITPAVVEKSKPGKTETAADAYIRSFQNHYHNSNS